MGTLLVDTLASLHTLDTGPFEGVCHSMTAREQVESAVDRLDTVQSVTGSEWPTLRSVGEWLLDNVPDEAQQTLLHGDFRPGNVLFAETTPPSITGVLDWETAMLGDPLTELGYLLLRWRDDGDPTPSLSGIEARHPDSDAIEQLCEVNEYGLAPFTARAGSHTRRELVARYEDLTGIGFENERFYRAHAAFMLATVWADLYRFRVEAGDPTDREPHIEYMALLADSIVSGEFPL